MTTHTPRNDNARRQPGEVSKAQTTSRFYDAPITVSNKRELRLLAALMEGATSREALDRRVGASNSPDLVFRLRQRGFELPCERREAIDRDGNPVRYGVYRLSARDADRATHALMARGAQ